MPLFQVITEKTYNGLEYWVNDYYVSTTDLLAAADIGEAIAGLEVELYFQPVTLTKIRASTIPVDVGQFVTRTVNLVPSTPPNAGLLPLFDVLRVDMTAATGRPGRKFYRAVITASDLQNGGQLKPASMANWQPILDSILTTGGLRKPSGAVIDSMDIYPAVGMRQLRRGSRKKLTPVI